MPEQTPQAPGPETVRGRSAAAEVAAAFADQGAAKRALTVRAAGVDPAVAKELGYLP